MSFVVCLAEVVKRLAALALVPPILHLARSWFLVDLPLVPRLALGVLVRFPTAPALKGRR